MSLRSRHVLKAEMDVVNKRGVKGVLAMQYFKSHSAEGRTFMGFTTGHALTMMFGKSNLKLEDIRSIAGYLRKLKANCAQS